MVPFFLLFGFNKGAQNKKGKRVLLRSLVYVEMPRSVVIHPTVASIATRPCFSSALREVLSPKNLTSYVNLRQGSGESVSWLSVEFKLNTQIRLLS